MSDIPTRQDFPNTGDYSSSDPYSQTPTDNFGNHAEREWSFLGARECKSARPRMEGKRNGNDESEVVFYSLKGGDGMIQATTSVTSSLTRGVLKEAPMTRAGVDGGASLESL
jgi:hypothetical protein